MELKRVVVTGLGAVTPLGIGVDETWNALINGVSGAGPITLFDASLFKTQFACEVKGFDPTKYLDKKEARKFDRYAQLAVASAKEAIEDSGYRFGESKQKPRRRYLHLGYRRYTHIRRRNVWIRCRERS